MKVKRPTEPMGQMLFLHFVSAGVVRSLCVGDFASLYSLKPIVPLGPDDQ